MQRRYDLDWLRVIAFALLMLFHTGMMFSTWDWHIKNLETSENFDLVMRFLHDWRMPLLFFISGSAVWFAMERYSSWRYFLERHKRLLLPLIFGMLVIIPPQVYVERLYGHQQFDSFWDFYGTVFTTGSYPEGNLSWHHLWYVPYIWTYSMLTLPVFLLIRSRGGRAVLDRAYKWLARPWCLFLVFVPSAVSDIVLRPYFPGDHMNLLADWGNFCHKLTFFVAGFMLASGTGVYDVIARHRRKFLVAGVVAYGVMQSLWSSYWHLPRWASVVYPLLHNFHIWMWLLALLGYGRRYLSFNHPALRYANEAVYPFYILHQTVIVVLGYQLVFANWSIGVKFLLVASGTFFITWLIYEYLIKRWNVLRVAFGMKLLSRRSERGERPARIVGNDAPEPVATLDSGYATPTMNLEKTARVVSLQSGAGTFSPPVLEGGSRTGTRTSRPLFALSSIAGLPGVHVLAGLFLLLLGVVLIPGCSGKHGELLSFFFSAPSLADNRLGIPSRQQVAVYLPPSYHKGNKEYPVLYLLPNFKHDLWRYTGGSYQGFRLSEAMDRQIASGRVREMIVVLPNVNHWLGGSWYLNSPLTGNWEDFVARDLVEYVDRHFRTIPAGTSRALAGHGMGGFGALELALKHPDVFGSVYAMSPPLFDAAGLRDLGALNDDLLTGWQARVEQWSRMKGDASRHAFRNYLQTRLNSPVRRSLMEGLCISYAAAVSPDLGLPYPHIAFPKPGTAGSDARGLARKFESGFGDWRSKLEEYLAKGRSLSAITVEYGGPGEYEWIRRGSESVSNLMRSMGIPNTLAAHDGGHESRLGERLETAMLPAISKCLKAEHE